MANNLNSPTYTQSVATTSVAVTLKPLDAAQNYVELYNSGATPIFAVSGTGSAPTAVFPTSATVPIDGTVIGAGVRATLEKPAGHEFISFISNAAGPSLIYASPIPSE